MEFTEVNITITYYKCGKEEDIEETKEVHHTLMIQEDKKSYFNPQEIFISEDMEKALKGFLQNQADQYRYLGFGPPEYYWINHIDGSGDDVT